MLMGGGYCFVHLAIASTVKWGWVFDFYCKVKSCPGCQGVRISVLEFSLDSTLLDFVTRKSSYIYTLSLKGSKLFICLFPL